VIPCPIRSACRCSIASQTVSAPVVSPACGTECRSAAADYHVSLSDAQWMLTIVFLVSAVATPVMGRLGDGPRRRATILAGLAVAAASLAVAAVVVPSSADRPAFRLDLPGAAMLGAGLAGLLVALSEGQDWGWGSPLLVAVAVTSLAVLAGWALVEVRRSHPLVELRLLRRAVVLAADGTVVLAGVGVYLMLSVVTRLVQTPVSSGYGLGGFIAGPRGLVAGMTSRVPGSRGSSPAGRGPAA
jgi:predicted MFS family arabinose efflux permease